MKNLILALALFMGVSLLSAQEVNPGSNDTEPSQANTLPSVDLKTMDGETINTAELSNDGKPIIISFWATWCKPCLQELIAISEVYADWQEETGVLLVAVSIDDAKSSAKVPTVVNGRGWEYMVLLDVNQDFKRAMGVNNPPHTFILDGNGKIIWQHTGYMQGDEEEYYEVLKQIIEAVVKPEWSSPH